METPPLKLQIDSKQARADLEALSRSLEKAGVAAGKMQQSFTTAAAGVDKALRQSTQSMGKFAEVAGLLHKIKLTSDPAKHLREFANALAAVGRVKTIDATQITRIQSLTRTLAEVRIPNHAQRLTQFLAAVATAKSPSQSTIDRLNNLFKVLQSRSLAEIKVPTGLNRLTQFMNAIAAVKVPTSSAIQRMGQLFKVLAAYKGTAATRNVAGMEGFFRTLAAVRVPSGATIQRLHEFLNTIGKVKAIPGAARIAHDLDMIAASATRAGAALKALPRGIVNMGPGVAGARKHVTGLSSDLHKLPGNAHRANTAIGHLGVGVKGLTDRFRLGYQASTLFSAFFASFTIGQFLRSIYDANIRLMKLQKAMLFTTGTFAGAEEATGQYIAMANRLGLALDKTTDAYSRFTISAKATGIDVQASNKIFESVGTALQVVGANSQQTELAFYGLTQMMQKGKVVSEEFNRQIGEQIPGNAVIGAAALSKLEGRVVSVAEFFKKMQLGQIMSREFVPVYAEELMKAYKPLLELSQLRPDVALNKLRNSFDMFAMSVGKAGFMMSLTKEFTRLRSLLIVTGTDGIDRLTPTAEKLAHTLGTNLSSMVRTLGKGLQFLVENLDDVITVLKALIGLKVATTMIGWNNSANAFTGAMATQRAEAMALAAARKAEATAAANAARANAAASAASGAAFAPYGPTFTASKPSFWSRFGIGAAGGAASALSVPAMQPGMPSYNTFGSNASNIATGGAAMGMARTVTPNTFGAPSAIVAGGATAAAARGAVTTSAVAANATKAAAGFRGLGAAMSAASVAALGLARTGVNAVATGFFKLGAIMPGVGPLAIAAAVALAVFSDKMTELETKAGNAVKVGDLTGSWLDSLGKSIGGWVAGLKHDRDKMGEHTVEWGKMIAIFLGSVQTVIGGLFALASTIGKVFGGIIATVIQTVMGLGVAIKRAMSGDFASAKAVLGNIPAQIGDIWGELGSSIKEDFKVFDVGRNVRNIMQGAGQRADARGAAASDDAANQALYNRLEQDLAKSEAERVAAQQQGELEALQRRVMLKDNGVPTLDDILTQVTKAADVTSKAATVNADAAQQVANAASTTAAGAQAAVKAVPQAPAAIAAAIKQAADKEGVDAALLTRIAFKESSFNPNAVPRDKHGRRVGTAGGLFQFTDGTAQQVGLKDRFDPLQASIAAARLTKINASFLKDRIGRDATGGELYAAHFLGAGGATSLIRANEKTPDAIAADMFKAAAAANPGVFYADGDKKRNPRTVKQVMDQLNQVGGATSVSGATVAGLSPTEEDSLTKRFDNFMEKYNRLVGHASPAASARAAFENGLIELKELADLQDDLIAKGLPPIMDPAEIGEAAQRLKKAMDDAVNPFAKMIRLGEEDAAIMEMRTKGLIDGAEFQEKLNDLVEQGYKVTDLDTEANRRNMAAMKDRKALLQSQLDLTQALNDATLSRIRRTGTALDAGIASRINIQEGETYEQALARAKANGSFKNITAAAQAEEGERRAGAAQTIRVNISEMLATAHMSASARTHRDDFKGFLEELTGISNATLDELQKRADPALVAMAKHAADIKHAIENGPGFQRWADGLEPLSQRLEDIKANFAENLSDTLTDALSGEEVDWDQLWKGLKKQVIKAQVDEGLKGILSIFNGGKAAGATPEAQAIIDASSATVTAAQGLATATDISATNLDTSAMNLNTAANALCTAASALSNLPVATGGFGGGASGGAPIMGDAIDAAFAAADAGDPSAAIQLGMMTPSASAGTPASFVQMGNEFIGTLAGARAAPTGFTPAPTNLISAMDGLDPFKPANNVDLLPGIGSLGVNLVGGASGAGAGGGFLSKIGGWLTGGQGGMKGIGSAAMKIGGIGAMLYEALHKKKKKPNLPPPPIHGVIGEHRPVDVSGEFVAAHENPIGALLSMAVSVAGGAGFGAPGGNLTNFLGSGASMAGTGGLGGWAGRAFGMGGGMGGIGGSMGGLGGSMGGMGGAAGGGGLMGLLGGLFGGGGGGGLGGLFGLLAGLFEEGGYATQPVGAKVMSTHTWRDAPHYKEGTPNTTGGIPAILHPNEAVIPLSRGRSVPVDLGEQRPTQSGPVMNTNITVIAPNPDSFRQAQGSIQRKTNRDLKRASVRNLTA